MRVAVLQRLETSDEGTFGHFSVKGFAAYSGELPWRDNAPSISCIPAGSYRCVATFSPRFRRLMYLVTGTDPRAGIRYHSANLMGAAPRPCQLNGCIALGEKLGWIDGQKALLLSRPAIRRFEEYFGWKPFLLEVRDA